MATLKRYILNGTSFFPTGVDTTDQRLADGPDRMVDGTLRIWHRAFKKKWVLTWTSIAETSMSAIRTLYRTTASFTLNDPDNVNYTVVSSEFSETLASDKISIGGIIYYDVSLTLEEV